LCVVVCAIVCGCVCDCSSQYSHSPQAIGKYEEALSSMPTNKETLVNCAISWYRLLLLKAEEEGWHDAFGSYFDESVYSDTLKISEYLNLAIMSDPKNPQTLCLYAQLLEKQRNFMAAEGAQLCWTRLCVCCVSPRLCQCIDNVYRSVVKCV